MTTTGNSDGGEVRLIEVGKGDGTDIMRSTYVDPDMEVSASFTSAGALTPLYPPGALTLLLDNSPSLRRVLEALAANVHGFGYRLVPTLDPDAEDSAAKVREAMVIQRVTEGDPLAAIEMDAVYVEPTDEEVNAKLEQLRKRALREKFALDMWLSGLAYEGTLESLRKATCLDQHLTGNAYWEVMRGGNGKPVKVRLLPSRYMRIGQVIAGMVDTKARIQTSPIDWTTQDQKRQFRKYLEWLDDGTVVYFKEFGDPRTMSRKTGNVYATAEEMKRAEMGALEATEIIHWSVPYPGSSYGVPLYAGTIPFIWGQRLAADTNYLYFENKSVPPMAITATGGQFTQETIARIERAIEGLKGRKGFWKMLLLELKPTVGPDGKAANSEIKFHTFAEVQQKDANFLQYDERCTDHIGRAFRIPRILTGDTKDFNRATAEAALEFAEQQVFQSERNQFDAWMNTYLLVQALGVQMWKFESLAPTAQDPKVLSEIIRGFCSVGVLTPKEGRELAAGVIGYDLPKIEADWVEQPLSLTLAGFAVEKPVEDGEAGTAGGQDAIATAAQEAARATLAQEQQDRAAEAERLAEFERQQAAAVAAEGTTSGQ